MCHPPLTEGFTCVSLWFIYLSEWTWFTSFSLKVNFWEFNIIKFSDVGGRQSVSAVVVGGVRSLVCPFSERQDEIVSFVHSWTCEPVLQLCSAEREEGDIVF